MIPEEMIKKHCSSTNSLYDQGHSTEQSHIIKTHPRHSYLENSISVVSYMHNLLFYFINTVLNSVCKYI